MAQPRGECRARLSLRRGELRRLSVPHRIAMQEPAGRGSRHRDDAARRRTQGGRAGLGSHLADRRAFGADDGGAARRRTHHDDEVDARPDEPARVAGVVAAGVIRGRQARLRDERRLRAGIGRSHGDSRPPRRELHPRKSRARFRARLHPFRLAVDGQLCRRADRCPRRRRVARTGGFLAEAGRRQAARAAGRQWPVRADRCAVPAGRFGHHRGRGGHADAARHPQRRDSPHRHQFRQAAAGPRRRPRDRAGVAAGQHRQTGAGPRPAGAGPRQHAARQYRRRRRRCGGPRRCRGRRQADRTRGPARDDAAAAPRRRRRLLGPLKIGQIPPLY